MKGLRVPPCPRYQAWMAGQLQERLERSPVPAQRCLPKLRTEAWALGLGTPLGEAGPPPADPKQPPSIRRKGDVLWAPTWQGSLPRDKGQTSSVGSALTATTHPWRQKAEGRSPPGGGC